MLREELTECKKQKKQKKERPPRKTTKKLRHVIFAILLANVLDVFSMGAIGYADNRNTNGRDRRRETKAPSDASAGGSL